MEWNENGNGNGMEMKWPRIFANLIGAPTSETMEGNGIKTAIAIAYKINRPEAISPNTSGPFPL